MSFTNRISQTLHDEHGATVAVDARTGRIAGFRRTFPEAEAGGSPDESVARAKAASVFSSFGLDPVAWDVVSSKSEARKARRDTHVVSESKLERAGAAASSQTGTATNSSSTPAVNPFTAINNAIHAGKLRGVKWGNWHLLRSEVMKPGLRLDSRFKRKTFLSVRQQVLDRNRTGVL